MKESQSRLTEVFARERGRFLAFIRRQAWELYHLDAEDILSEVFFNLFSRADLVAGTEHITAYIYRSLRHQVIDARRRERGRREDLDLAQALADDRPGADDLLHASELRARLDQALATLKPKERAV
jgi:RNA polymerase sigma factor (sigma-70 family)